MVTLRLFQPSDTQKVLKLINANASFDGVTTEVDLAMTAQFPQALWIAEDDGAIVGCTYGTLKSVPDTVLERWGANRVGEVTLLIVNPNYRNRGIGTALLAKLIDA